MSSPTRRELLVAAAVVALAAGELLLAGLHVPLGATIAVCFLAGLRTRSAGIAAAVAVAGIAVMTATNQLADQQYSLLDDLAFFALLLGPAAGLGQALRRRSDAIADLRARAADLEAAHADEAAAAVAEERARLAIALHDAVAHRVGEMTLQAAGAERLASAEPERALSALAHIEASARSALDDIREAIGVLRRGHGSAELAPPVAGPGELPAPPVPAATEGATPAAAGPDRPAVSRLDLLVAAGVFTAMTIETLTSSRLEGSPWLNALGLLAVAAPLALRRRAPLASATAVFAAAAVHGAFLTPLSLLVTPIVLLLLLPYSVAAGLPLRGALAGLAICIAGTLVLEPAVPTVVLGLLAWGAGRAVRDRGRRLAELEALTAALERAKGAGAARARSEERLRVARELHDAVAHSMTVVVLQAEAAQRVWRDDPAAARHAVAAMSEVARDTLADLRVTLRAEAPVRAESLEDLVERVRPLGLDVRLDRDPAPLPPAVDAVTFAIVQEALTNAARHAAPTTVDVRVRHDAGAVHVEVADSGRRPGAPAAATAPVVGTGTGLRGMAERVAAHGGELRYGAHGAGFRIEARLPVEEPVAA